MSMKNRFLALLGVGAMAFSACKKEATDWSYGTDNSTAEALYGDVYGQISNTSESDGNLRNGCLTITFASTPGEFPNTVTLDFGTTGCLGDDFRTRKGKIHIHYTGRWRTAGTVVTATLENYEVNGYKIEGVHTITNNGQNGAGHITYTSTVTDGAVTDLSGATATWNRTTVHEWAAGQNTSFITDGAAGVLDDVWHITGSGDGVTRNGNAYTAEITETIVHELDCRWYTAGRVDVTPAGGGVVRAVDFGDGTTCDSKVTVYYGNYSQEVDLVQ